MANKSNSHDAFPKQVKLSDGTEVTLRHMQPADQEKILTFASKLREEDLLFLRTDITDRQVVKQWAENIKDGHTVTLLAELNGEGHVGKACQISVFVKPQRRSGSAPRLAEHGQVDHRRAFRHVRMQPVNARVFRRRLSGIAGRGPGYHLLSQYRSPISQA